MSRSYGLLLAVMLMLGLLLVWVGHERHGIRRPAPAPRVPSMEAVSVTVRDSVVDPPSIVVPKGSRVRLTVRNGGGHAVRVALAGYADRFALVALRPGETAEREFTADLPGEDFAWLVNGEPVGRFQVSGSHLVEGHR